MKKSRFLLKIVLVLLVAALFAPWGDTSLSRYTLRLFGRLFQSEEARAVFGLEEEEAQAVFGDGGGGTFV